MKMRISLSHQGDDIKGVIDLPGNDPGFVLEGLALVVDRFSRSSGVTHEQVLQDIYLLIKGVVK